MLYHYIKPKLFQLNVKSCLLWLYFIMLPVVMNRLLLVRHRTDAVLRFSAQPEP